MRAFTQLVVPSLAFSAIRIPRSFNSSAGAGTPSESEVRAAYTVLGVRAGSSFADIRKRYIELAKVHHPDVHHSNAAPTATAEEQKSGGSASSASTQSSSASSSPPPKDGCHHTERMISINDAYQTVNRYHKTGKPLPGPVSHSTRRTTAQNPYGFGSSFSETPGGRTPYSANENYAYEPLWEDINPLMHEMMWEEMRQQAEQQQYQQYPNPHEFDGHADGNSFSGPFGSFWSPTGGGYGGGARREPYRRAQPSRRNSFKKGSAGEHPSSSEGDSSRSTGDGAGSKSNPSSASSSSSSTSQWTEEQRSALHNMYEDGKSFDFIANALGKQEAEVVSEFNAWRSASKQRNQNNNSNGKRNKFRKQFPLSRSKKNSGPYNPYYYAESPEDGWIDMNEFDAYGGVPYGYSRVYPRPGPRQGGGFDEDANDEVYNEFYIDEDDIDGDMGGMDGFQDFVGSGARNSRGYAHPYEGKHQMHRGGSGSSTTTNTANSSNNRNSNKSFNKNNKKRNSNYFSGSKQRFRHNNGSNNNNNSNRNHSNSGGGGKSDPRDR